MIRNSIVQRIQAIKATLPSTTRLVAVSKFHPAESILVAYEGGQRIFGESRAQELREKQAVLPKDIEWHFIGHLQENKVKYIAPFVSLIHSIDSLSLLKEVERQGEKCGRVIPCLLELHVAQEESKFGLSFQQCQDLLCSEELASFHHVLIKGVMGMASFTDDEEQVRDEFHRLATFYRQLKSSETPYPNTDFCELSMGMSHDYLWALEEGATLVRIGTTIFGERVY